MSRIQPELIRKARTAESAADLRVLLQHAIELEHSTIPPYLTALFSLRPGSNDLIAGYLREIVVQEMKHMTIAANVLNAIGGEPDIDHPGFIPAYPGPLPMGIGGPEFRVGVEAFSPWIVKHVFMRIEEPETPQVIPVGKPDPREHAARLKAGVLPSGAPLPTFDTIGEFYDALKAKIGELGERIFTGDPARQVTQWLYGARVDPVTDVASARAGLDLIIREGEGSTVSVFEHGADPAHYYKFAEIVRGMKIRLDEHGQPYYSTAPEDAIPFNEFGVIPFQANTKIADFPEGTLARTRVSRFAYSYSSLLRALHDVFNGQPERIASAIGQMYEMKMIAVSLAETSVGGGKVAGPSYEYVRTQGGMG